MQYQNDEYWLTSQYRQVFEVKEWTQNVWKDFFTHSPFELTPEQERIIEALGQNNTLTNTEIAQLLNKKKNTIDVQNKHLDSN